MPRYIDADALKARMLSYYGCVNENTAKENYRGETLMNYEVADHLIENGVVILDPQKYPPVTNRGIIDSIMEMPLDEMAELIRAKQEGRIIVPPCKVGDTAYRITRLYNGETIIVEGIVFEFAITHESSLKDTYRFYFWAQPDETYTSRKHSLWCEFVDFGKTVFLTREEAERALKGGE